MLRTVKNYSTLAGLLLLATAWSIRPVSDIDVQWHLKIGSWMLEHHKVVRNDFFSVSRWGMEWISIPWLYQCTLAWLVRHTGWLGPTLWQWLTAILITVQSGLLLTFFRRPGRWEWIWPALSLPAALGLLHILLVSESRFLHRPEMISHVLISTYLLLLLLFTREGQRLTVPAGTNAVSASTRLLPSLRRGGIWLLPILQIVWVNSHDLAVLGLILVWTFVGADWLNALLLRQTQTRAGELVQITGVGLAVLAACFVSPYGWDGGILLLQSLPALLEHGYTSGIDGGKDFFILLALSMAMLGLGGHIAAISRRSITERAGLRRWWKCFDQQLGLGYLLSCGCFLYISLTVAPCLPLFSLVAVPLVVAGIEYLADGFRWLTGEIGLLRRGLVKAEMQDEDDEEQTPRSEGFPVSRFSRILSPLFFFGLLAFLYQGIVSERYYEWLNRSTRFAIGQSDHSYPLAALNFLEQNKSDMDHGAMLGDMKSANAFLNRFGPGKKTYIDGRSMEVFDSPFFSRYAAVLGTRDAFFAEAGNYGITLAVFSMSDMPQNRRDLMRDIYRHPDWALLYLDDSGVIFAARTAASNEVISKYAMPQPPATMEEQNMVYLEWLKKIGRTEYSLYDPANRAMDDSGFTRGLLFLFRLGGVIETARNQRAWNYARTASLLSGLGWPVVADTLYDEAAAMEPMNVRVIEDAINHAISCFKEASLPEARRFYADRIRNRSELLSYHHYNNPVALFGTAFTDMVNDRPAAALETLLLLKQQRRNVEILDMIARLQGEMGDLAEEQPRKEKFWKEAVACWRERLAEYPSGPGTYRAYLRLADLFLRLSEPLPARANYMLALAEPDITSQAAEQARQYVKQLDETLFGKNAAHESEPKKQAPSL